MLDFIKDISIRNGGWLVNHSKAFGNSDLMTLLGITFAKIKIFVIKKIIMIKIRATPKVF